MAFASAYKSISHCELPATCVLHDVAGSSPRQVSGPRLLARLPPAPSPEIPVATSPSARACS
jgi:hypothetical protein